MNATLAESYAHCRRLARRSATNFYYPLWLLPRPKRQAMYALYAFLRHTDDLGDSDEPTAARAAALARWRSSLDAALAGHSDAPILAAVADVVARCEIPPEYLYAAIEGVQMDLAGRRYETFDDLAVYCHHVAGVVGLACIHIWGFRGSGAFEPAEKCGLAFQLTNILRDLHEDVLAGRVYLPLEDLRRYECTEEDLRRGGRRLAALVGFEVARAEHLYSEAAALADWLEPDGQAVFGAMWSIYRALLKAIKQADGNVSGRRIRLPAWRKLSIAARWLLTRSGPPRDRMLRTGTP